VDVFKKTFPIKSRILNNHNNYNSLLMCWLKGREAYYIKLRVQNTHVRDRWTQQKQVVIRYTLQSLFVICRRRTAWRRRYVSVVASGITTITMSSTNVCFKEDELLFCYRPDIITGCIIRVAGDDAVQRLITEEVRRNTFTIKLRGIWSSKLFQRRVMWFWSYDSTS
jgi:hypothetical protein